MRFGQNPAKYCKLFFFFFSIFHRLTPVNRQREVIGERETVSEREREREPCMCECERGDYEQAREREAER
jgi:hypothetical protein